MDPINQAAADQNGRSLAMLRAAITNCPEAEWRRGDTSYQRPAGLALHVVETVEFYTSGLSGDEFPWGKRFGVDWEGGADGEFPSQQELLASLDEVEAYLETWLATTDLLGANSTYPWTGTNVLGRTIYIARHTQHHVAEIALELGRRGATPPEWK